MLKPYVFLFRGEEMPTFATCLNITVPQKTTRQITLLDLSVVVVVRLEHSHSFTASLDNHYTASGPGSSRRRRPPGNAVSGHSSTMCLYLWSGGSLCRGKQVMWSHPIGGEIRRIWHLRRFKVTNWRLDRVNPGCWHVGLVTRSCPGGTPWIHDCSHVSCSVWFRFASRAASITKGRRDLRRDLGGSRRISLMGTRSVSCWAFLYSCRVTRSRRICGGSMSLSTGSQLMLVGLKAPETVRIAMLSCVSMCWTWAHLPHTGTQYSANEYTRAIADVRITGAEAPQSVPASLLMMLQRDFTLSRTFSVCLFVVLVKVCRHCLLWV